MRVVLPLMLVVLLAAGGFGLVFLQKSLASGDLKIEPIGDTALGTALSMVVDDVTGNNVIKTEGDLRGLMPPAPEGWTVRPYELADGTAITETEMIRTMVSKSTTNTILQSFAHDAGVLKGAEVFTYENGDQKMALRMRLLDRFNERSLRGGLMASISESISASSFDGTSRGAQTAGLFAKLDGIEVIERPRFSRVTSSASKIPVNYRTFSAKVGVFLEIQLITNASDAAVASLMSQLDMKTLNAILPENAVEYRPDVGWQVASTEPLSDVPPGQSLASKAYEILHNGRIHPDDETRVLAKMASGDLFAWDDVRENIAPSENLIFLLGPEPDDRKIKRLAGEMLAADPDMPEAMDRIVNGISRGSITSQAEVFANRYFRDVTMTPEFRALLGMLPVGSAADIAPDQPAQATQQEAAVEVDTRPIIRRGVAVSDGAVADSCTIELGVRRCVISDGE